jgi:hypothetical protein
MHSSQGIQHFLGTVGVSILLMLSGCAAVPLNSQSIAPRFYGVWTNTDSSVYNWLEIDANHVVSYGLTQWNGSCDPTPVDVAAPDQLILPVGAVGAGQLAFALDGAVLVISGRTATARYVPSSREDICRGPGGKYLPGAPYPKS